MKITQMRASFGRLKNAGLSLGPGLNIVQGRNRVLSGRYPLLSRSAVFTP